MSADQRVTWLPRPRGAAGDSSELGESAPFSRPSLARRILREPTAWSGLAVLLLLVLACVFGPMLFHYDPNHQSLSEALQGPSAKHWLGTDSFGRDELVRLLYGGRYSMLLGVIAVLIGVCIGLPIGSLSGYFGGWPDTVIQGITEVVLSFPGILLALALVATLGVSTNNLVIAIAVSSIPIFVRLARSSALTIRTLPFVEAARALGKPSWRIVAGHVIPNSLGPIIVQASLQVGLAVLTAAGLGFLGLGVPPPTPEWGAMLGESRNAIFRAPLLSTYPGVAI